MQKFSNELSPYPKEKRDKDSWMVYTDNRIGPGAYEPNLDAHLRQNPKFRMPRTKRHSIIDSKE